jgi:hypothetical protein
MSCPGSTHDIVNRQSANRAARSRERRSQPRPAKKTFKVVEQ